MYSSQLRSFLDERGIEVLEDLGEVCEERGLEFLRRFGILEERGVKLDFINRDLFDVVVSFDVENDGVLDRFVRVNWSDFFSTFSQRGESSRKRRIYDSFVLFLKEEFGILDKDSKEVKDRSLVGDFSGEGGGKNFEKFGFFERQEDFDLEKDLKQKCEKFDLEVVFDYCEKPKKVSVNDFVLYFNRRLEYFTNLLRGRVNLDNVVRISKLKDVFGTNSLVSVIGLVSDISETKNGHYVITLEDKSGQVKCFVNKDKKDVFVKVSNLCLDEGVAVVGKAGKDIIWVDDFVVPSPPAFTGLKKTEREEYVVCISDLHFGAKVFVDDAFAKFLDWICGRTGNEKLNEMARKVKYVVVAGDVIEGIGIYPGQGQDARILSTELQYHEAARWLSQIPEDKCIVVVSGNHDTNRLSEPQPKPPYERVYALYNMPNVIFLSNPSIVKLFCDDPCGGLDFYLYHGGSIFYYANKISHLREKGGAKVPEEVVKFLLEKRHLAPSHGSTLYIPDSQRDPLVIRKMPDFFVTGHTHKMGVANYKGCSILSCGCWVEMSDYQEKMGMFPDIGKCFLVNTRTREPKVLSFYSEKRKE